MTTLYVDGNAGGTNAGTSWANAWTALSSAGDTANIAPGDIILVSDGFTYIAQDGATGAVLNVDDAGDIANGPIVYQGCDGTGDETSFVTAQVTIDAGTNTLNYGIIPSNYNSFRNLTITGAAIAGIGSTSASHVAVQDCVLYTTAIGIQLDDNCVIHNCTIYDNTRGIDVDYRITVTSCKFWDNDDYDIFCFTGYIIDCLMYSGATTHVYILSDVSPSAIIGCTIDGDNADIGIDFADATNIRVHTIVNNCIYDLATGMQSSTTYGGFGNLIDTNLFNSNVADTDADLWIGTNPLSAAPAFIDSVNATLASRNYLPEWSSASPLIDAGAYVGSYGSIGAVKTGDFPALANVDTGDTVNSEAGTGSIGGGGLIVHPGMTGGMRG